jgi:nitrogen fixation protein FixH
MIVHQQEFTGRQVLMVMIAFFAVVLTANLTMVFFARQSWTGLVVKNSYVASQEFNETTAAMLEFNKITPVIEVTNGTLRVTLTGNNGEPVIAKDVKLLVGRPTHEGDDAVIQLQPEQRGTYTGLHSLAQGQWSGTISAEISGHKNWYRPVRLFVKD